MCFRLFYNAGYRIRLAEEDSRAVKSSFEVSESSLYTRMSSLTGSPFTDDEEQDTLDPAKEYSNQDWNRVLVSLISWLEQLLSLFPCERLKFLARMLFLGILSRTIVRMLFSYFVWPIILADGKISHHWFRKSHPRCIDISILLLEFIFPFVCPYEYITIPGECAQGWYSGSTPGTRDTIIRVSSPVSTWADGIPE